MRSWKSDILRRERREGGAPHIEARRRFNAQLRRRLRGGGGEPLAHDRAMELLSAYSYRHSCSSRSTQETYGEIVDMRGLLAHLPEAPDKESVFVDVGSGYGRFALYLALVTPCARVVGIELQECRHKIACKKQSQHRARAPHLDFQQGDVRKLGVPSGTTHMYLASTCFGDELCRDIVALAPAGCRCIVSLRPLDSPGWKLHSEHPVQCTWATSTAHYYVPAGEDEKESVV